MEGLSIDYIDSTCEDVYVTYTPSYLVKNYTYQILKNNELTYTSENLTDIASITFDKTGTYIIEITNNYYDGTSDTLKSGEYKIDKEPPIINVKDNTYKIKKNEKLNIDIKATDMVDGDLTSKITSNIDSIDFKSEGIKKVEYSVSDAASNTTTKTIYVTVTKDYSTLIKVGQFGILISLLVVILFLIRYIRSLKLEKRFSKFTINSSKTRSSSLLDILHKDYLDFIGKISKVLSKSAVLKKHSKRYDKISLTLCNGEDSMNFISRKIVVGVLFILFTVLVGFINSRIVGVIEILISFIIGFLTLDIIYRYKYIRYKKKIEKDLLEAITLMNNGFKAGMSIMQVVSLVSLELKGPIAKEFEKIELEITLGLDIEVAFKRFAKRVKSEEAIYLASSLSVLNKTGGNIIEVFNSIEKNMFARRKLNNELKSLTSSSRLVMYVLMFIPIIFVVFINIINKDYFEPLLTNKIGIIIILLMIIIYTTYIIVVRKVLNVRRLK